MNKTSISWVKATDGSPGFTWSPVVGCSPVSAGCKNCWAARLAATRLAHLPEYQDLARCQWCDDIGDMLPRESWRYTWIGDVCFLADRLAEPLLRRKPSGIAVSLMGDLFHPKVTNEQIAAVFGVMAACPQHRFYVCTKRAKRRLEWFEWIAQALPSCHPLGAARGVRWYASGEFSHHGDDSSAKSTSAAYGSVTPKWTWPLPNVIQLTSVEDQATFDERIMDTVATPAAVRGLSIEPLLGPIDLHLLSTIPKDIEPSYMHALTYLKINWVIVGCESGPNARPMRHEWAASIWRQCLDAGVPFFYKQAMTNVYGGKLCHEPRLEGKTWRQMP